MNKRWQIYKRIKTFRGWSEWKDTIEINIDPTKYLSVRNAAHIDVEWIAKPVLTESKDETTKE